MVQSGKGEVGGAAKRAVFAGITRNFSNSGRNKKRKSGETIRGVREGRG